MTVSIKQGISEEILEASHTFYHTYSTDTAGAEGELRLMPVCRTEMDAWLGAAGRHTFTAWQGDRLVGLCAGAEGRERACGYLSYLCVAPDCRHAGIGTRLMNALEETLGGCPGIQKMEIVFHNPVHLPWYLPGAGEDWHPCMPGVDMASSLYPFLQKRGYQMFAQQNAYHQRLAGYADPLELRDMRQKLFCEGIELTVYDPTHHYGLPELFDNINNPGWKAQVLAHTDLPIVVAVDHTKADKSDPAGGLVVAYTGPLSVEGTPGRGNFCGIGTRTDYRGRGIGTLVFREMCRRHAMSGADFMSLYTGETNPARRIYEAAGFRILRSFADMQKELPL